MLPLNMSLAVGGHPANAGYEAPAFVLEGWSLIPLPQ
jgi:hypothetical protein